MSEIDEGKILHFSIDLDTLECPSCEVAGTLCFQEREIEEERAYKVRCMNPECHKKGWVIAFVLQPVKKNQWQMEV